MKTLADKVEVGSSSAIKGLAVFVSIQVVKIQTERKTASCYPVEGPGQFGWCNVNISPFKLTFQWKWGCSRQMCCRWPKTGAGVSAATTVVFLVGFNTLQSSWRPWSGGTILLRNLSGAKISNWRNMLISSVLPSVKCEKLLSKSELKSLGFNAKKDLCGGRLIRRRSSIIFIKQVKFDKQVFCDLKISDLHISP